MAKMQLGWHHFSKAGVTLASCVHLSARSIKTMKEKNLEKGKRTIENEGSEEEKPKKQKLEQQGHWASGLLQAMEDPNLKVEDDELVTVIKDKYPKAEYHYLVLPKEDIPSLKELNETHRSLLKHMNKEAKKLAKAQPDRVFKIGFHARPSMTRLHLHVISDDFNSPGLKTKKHWNSYTTEFFVPYEDVKSAIKTNGKYVPKPQEELDQMINRVLTCHKCSFISKTIPNLKKHVSQTHFKKENKHTKFNN